VSQSAGRCEETHVAAFACFELGMSKAQAAQDASVSFTHMSRVPCTKVLSQTNPNFCVLQVSLLDFTNTI